MFFPDIFATITLIHKQIIAVAGYYACGAFILLLFFRENKADESHEMSSLIIIEKYKTNNKKITPAEIVKIDLRVKCICYGQCISMKRRQDGLGGSVGCTVRLETRRSWVQPPPRSATFFRGD